MLREILFNNTSLPLYKNGLDAFTARHRAVASNIANSETPGYQARKVNFEARLKQALGDPNEPLVATNSRHMPVKGDYKKVKHLVVQDDRPLSDSGVNKVDVEREMARLATNQIHYQLLAKRSQGVFKKLKSLTQLP